MAESYSIEAILKANVADFVAGFKKAEDQAKTFVDKNKETFDSFKQVGAAATAGGVAVAVGLGGAVKIAANFEAGMSKVGAISGATGVDMEKLSDKAREMGSSTSFSATEAAEGLEYMALAGFSTEQMLGGITPILHLAEAGALELGRTSDLVTDSMAGLGLEVSDLDGYLDKVAQTSRKSNTDIDALMEAFVIAGGTFERLNVPLEESNAMLGVLANRGFKGSEAGTAMNAIMTRLTSTTGPAAKALEEMGISAYDSEGNFRGMETVLKEVEAEMANMTDAEKAHYQTQLAGLDHGKTFSAMLAGLGDEYDDLKGSIIDSDGALLDMRNTMKDNLQGDLENLSSALEEIAISIGTALMPVVKKMTEFVQSLADKFNNLDSKTKTIIAVIAALSAGFLLLVGPILMLIGFIPQILAGFAAVVTVFKAVAAAIGLIFSPIGLVVAAIIAAAALIYIYWEPISEFFIALWGGIKEAGLAIWESLKEVWSASVEAIKAVWATVTEFFSNLWETIEDISTAVWDALTSAVLSIIQPFIDSAVNLFTNLKDGLVTIMEGLKTFFSGVWDLIKNIFLGAVILLLNLVTGNFEELKNNAKAILDNMKDAINKIWEGIKTIFTGVLQAITGFVKGAWNNIKTNTVTIFNAVKTFITNIWNGIKTFFTTTLSNLVTTAKDKFEEVKGAIKDKMSDAVKVVSEKVSEMPGKVVEKVSEMVSAGKDLIRGLIDGIKNMAKGAIDAITGVVDGVVNKAKSLLGIKSPSRVFMAVGGYIGEGLADGISGTEKENEKASAALTDKLLDELNDLKATAFEQIKLMGQIVSEELNGIKKAWGLIIHDIIESMKVIFGELYSVGVNAGRGLYDGLASMEAPLVAKATAIANAVKAAMAGALDIHSPSRWMRDMIGKNMMLGWIDGIESMKSKVEAMSLTATDWMKPNVAGLNVPSFDRVNTRGYNKPSNQPNSSSGGSGGITQHITINSPKPTSPSDNARLIKQQSRQLAAEWGV